MTDHDGASEHQPTDQEAQLRSYVIPRAYNLCEYLDREGLQKLKDGHMVKEKVSIPLGKITIEVTMEVRKVDA